MRRSTRQIYTLTRDTEVASQYAVWHTHILHLQHHSHTYRIVGTPLAQVVKSKWELVLATLLALIPIIKTG